MRHLFLHVGLHKTGTSYLQKFIRRNADLLAGAGLELAPYDDRRTHDELVAGLHQRGPRHFLNSLGWHKGDTILVTSEGLSHAFRNQELTHEFSRAAKSENIRLTLILVLRRQDILKESVFSEVVKTWYQGSIFDEVHYNYDFNQRVINLENAFKQENIRIILYGGHSFKSLSESFTEQLNLRQILNDMVDVPSQNVSMHRRKTLFLSQVPKQNTRLAKDVRSTVEKSNVIKDDGLKYMMSPKQRAEFLAQYLEGNKTLLARYNLDEPSWFTPASPTDAEWTPPSPIEPREYAGILLEALELVRNQL